MPSFGYDLFADGDFLSEGMYEQAADAFEAAQKWANALGQVVEIIEWRRPESDDTRALQVMKVYPEPMISEPKTPRRFLFFSHFSKSIKRLV